MPILTAMAAATFALIHIFIGKLRFLDEIPRSRWLSLSGGASVAYVFLHVFPELNAHHRQFAEHLAINPRSAEKLIYVMALAGLAIFYGLERMAKMSRAHVNGMASPRFWIHVGSFAIYNLLIGYLLLSREEAGVIPLLLYALAMGLHFLSNDFGLRQDHRAQYDRLGRWVIAAAVILGWAAGLVLTLPAVAVGLLFALLAGGVILNILKEELPEERESRFSAFALGLVGYALLMIVVV